MVRGFRGIGDGRNEERKKEREKVIFKPIM
jgi:hypothetical protein